MSAQSYHIWTETWQIRLTFNFPGKRANSDLLFAETFEVIFIGRWRNWSQHLAPTKAAGLTSPALLPCYLAVLAWDENLGSLRDIFREKMCIFVSKGCLSQRQLQRMCVRLALVTHSPDESFRVLFSLHFNILPFLFWRKEFCGTKWEENDMWGGLVVSQTMTLVQPW